MFECVAHTGPRLRVRGGQEPPFPHRLLGVRHTAPDPDTPLGGTAQVPQVRVHDVGMSYNDCHV